MALKGEGDPRWVVRERNDGRNVNGWHWEDRDVTDWAKSRLKHLLTLPTCQSASPPPGVASTSVESVDGDATLYNRKGVLKVLYDLKIAGRWASLHEDEALRTKGEFKLELFDDDPDVFVSMDADGVKDACFKRSFETAVVPTLQEVCRKFVAELHAGAGVAETDGLKKKAPGPSVNVSRTEMGGGASAKPANSSAASTNSTGAPAKKGAPARGEEVVMREHFSCTVRDWTLALTDGARLSAVTRSRVTSEATAGGRWEVLGGAAHGVFERVDVAAGLVDMRWRLRSWGDDAPLGTLAVRVAEEDGGVEAEVVVGGVPPGKASETEGFWRVQILQAMRVVMGWGNAAKFAGM